MSIEHRWSSLQELRGLSLSPKYRDSKELGSSQSIFPPATGSGHQSGTSGKENLATRREKRIARARPWNEIPPRPPSNSNTKVEIHYESCLPKGRWMNFNPKQYVVNHRYGHVFEVRRRMARPKSAPALGPQDWLWENEFRIWRFEKAREKERYESSVALRHSKSSRVNSAVTRKSVSKIGPHQDLFERFNSYRLEKAAKRRAAVKLQKHLRGWLVRKRMEMLKQKALVDHHSSWHTFMRDYRNLMMRIQKRFDVDNPTVSFNMRDIGDFMDKKKRYEDAFLKVTQGCSKLPREELPDFFKECGLFPSEREIKAAFESVFKGCGTQAEIVFLLDCSASVGELNFKAQMSFVKEMVVRLEIGPERVRVGVVPFSDEAYQVIQIDACETKDELITEIEKIKYRRGLTRTDEALLCMRNMWTKARPGVPKLGLVITDGQSYHTHLTCKEAHKAKIEETTMFALGVGHKADKKELTAIASGPEYVYNVYDYFALGRIINEIVSKTCLGSCTLCHFVVPDETRPRHRGLYKSEVMEILWMIYVPKSTGLIKTRKSTWMNPIIDGEEAVKLVGAKEWDNQDFKAALHLVVRSKIQREGSITLPSGDRQGVKTYSNVEAAYKHIENFLDEKKDKELKEFMYGVTEPSEDEVEKNEAEEEDGEDVQSGKDNKTYAVRGVNNSSIDLTGKEEHGDITRKPTLDDDRSNSKEVGKEADDEQLEQKSDKRSLNAHFTVVYEEPKPGEFGRPKSSLQRAPVTKGSLEDFEREKARLSQLDSLKIHIPASEIRKQKEAAEKAERQALYARLSNPQAKQHPDMYKDPGETNRSRGRVKLSADHDYQMYKMELARKKELKEKKNSAALIVSDSSSDSD